MFKVKLQEFASAARGRAFPNSSSLPKKAIAPAFKSGRLLLHQGVSDKPAHLHLLETLSQDRLDAPYTIFLYPTEVPAVKNTAGVC